MCRTLWSIVSLFEISQECPKGLQGRSTPIQHTWGAPGLRDHGVGALPEWQILNGKSWDGRSSELLGLAVLERGGPGIRHPGVHGARSADGDTIVFLPVNRLPMAQEVRMGRSVACGGAENPVAPAQTLEPKRPRREFVRNLQCSRVATRSFLGKFLGTARDRLGTA